MEIALSDASSGIKSCEKFDGSEKMSLLSSPVRVPMWRLSWACLAPRCVSRATDSVSFSLYNEISFWD